MTERATPWWSWAAPLAAGALIVGAYTAVLPSGTLLFRLVAPFVLIASVFSAVRHAETVSVRLGEALGIILLALAVTAIEVSLISSVMLRGQADPTTVARDTVFGSVIVVLTGVVGLSLLLGGLRHHEQAFQLQGTASALGVLGTLSITSMVLPNYTLAEEGPVFSPVQLLFVSLASLVLYSIYLLVQAGRQRQYFVSPDVVVAGPGEVSRSMAGFAGVMLLATLAMVVLLADSLTPALHGLVQQAGLDNEFVGAVIAMIVLLPEGTSAVVAARANRLQSSLNFALGSAIASVGLTIPAISLLSFTQGLPIALGLEAEHMVVLVMALFVATLTLSTGRTTILQGAVHLVIFVIFLLIAAVP